MADNGRWFKLWCSAISDPDLDNLDIADFGRWAKLGAFIKVHGKSGEIILSEPAREVVSMMQLPSFNDVILCVKRFPNVTVSNETNTTVSYKIKYENWHIYQEDFSTERVRKFREKNAKNETPKKRREEKRREENIIEENIIKESQESPLNDFFNLWNEYASKSNLISAREFSDRRKQKASKRLSERPLSEWQEVFSLCARTPFLNGLSKDGWRASFDWITASSDNAIKVLEGKYGKPLVEFVTQEKLLELRQGGTVKQASQPYQNNDRFEKILREVRSGNAQIATTKP